MTDRYSSLRGTLNAPDEYSQWRLKEEWRVQLFFCIYEEVGVV